MKKVLHKIIPFLVSMLLLGTLFFVMRGSIPSIIATLKAAHRGYFILAAVIFMWTGLILGCRLNLLLNAQGINLGPKTSIALVYIGYFFNNFLPTAIGGDIVKAYYASKTTHKKIEAVSAVIVDRFLGLISYAALAMIATIALGSQLDNPNIKWSVIVIGTVIAMLALFFANPGFAKKLTFLSRILIFDYVRHKAAQIYYSINSYAGKKETILKTMGLSVLLQLSAITAIYILLLSIDAHIKFVLVLLFMPIIGIISMIPSVNGLGVREGAVVLLFGPIIGREKAFALSILFLAILFIMGMMGGLVYIFLRNRFKLNISEITDFEETSDV
ncbi:MAG: flippase-like domain-containing protein [Candidatus Omnitrophica bacterium]|nr:flippase-like domain-containing protein [Candidatus Omnitrophota bacterium]